MNVPEALALVGEWSDDEGVSVENVVELDVLFLNLLASVKAYGEEEMSGNDFEDLIHESGLAIFQLGRAVGRPKLPDVYEELNL